MEWWNYYFIIMFLFYVYFIMMFLPCLISAICILPFFHWNFNLTLMGDLLHASVICSLVVGRLIPCWCNLDGMLLLIVMSNFVLATCQDVVKSVLSILAFIPILKVFIFIFVYWLMHKLPLICWRVLGIKNKERTQTGISLNLVCVSRISESILCEF